MSSGDETILGYSVFELFEECYAYNENACYIGDSPAAARRFGDYALLGAEYRIEPVTLDDMLQDFGYSGGEFALEGAAWSKFRASAERAGVDYESESLDDLPQWMLVRVAGVKVHRD